MIVDLVKVTTSDGMRLHGALHAPEVPPALNVDAVVCLHGVASSFYGSLLFESITPSLRDLGLAVLWVNTRGHDGLNTAISTGQRRRQGAAYEVVDECRFDIAAWADFLVDRGFQRIGLLGHSLGAIKAIYAQAHEPHAAVRRIIASSPPRLSFSCFNNAERSAEFFQTISAAEELVAEGKPEQLMEVTFPFPLLITAGGYVDKYGRKERYNILRFAERLDVPTLFTYGERELEGGGVAFAGVPEALARLSPPCGPFEIKVIPGADHSYFGTFDVLAGEVASWLKNRKDS